jgi:hypothetical protein
MVLGRTAVQVHAPAFIGRRYVIGAWRIADDGRKHDAGTAIYADDGSVIATASARWIDVAAVPAQAPVTASAAQTPEPVAA